MADVLMPSTEIFSSAGPQFSRTEVYHSPPGTPVDDCTDDPMSFGAASTNSTTNESVAEQVALAMGIPDTVIQMARDFHYLQHGTDFSDARQLFLEAEDLLKCPQKQYKIGMMLYEAEQAKKEQAKKEKKSHSTDSFCSTQVCVSPSAEMQKNALAEPNSSVDDREKLRERVRNLAKENSRLRRRKTCCKCKQVDLASSGVTFLPCGHFITCETCSEVFEDCPACGKSIMGTVRTFLS